MSDGIKFDDDKIMMELLPFDSLLEVGKVLTHGAKKYEPNNWKLIKDPNRYIGALIRHLAAYQCGEKIDPDSGLTHISHLACNALFLIHFELQKDKKDILESISMDSNIGSYKELTVKPVEMPFELVWDKIHIPFTAVFGEDKFEIYSSPGYNECQLNGKRFSGASDLQMAIDACNRKIQDYDCFPLRFCEVNGELMVNNRPMRLEYDLLGLSVFVTNAFDVKGFGPSMDPKEIIEELKEYFNEGN